MVTKPAKYMIRKICVLDKMAQAGQLPALFGNLMSEERENHGSKTLSATNTKNAQHL